MHLPFNDPFAASPSWQPALDDLVRSVGGRPSQDNQTARTPTAPLHDQGQEVDVDNHQDRAAHNKG